MTRALVIGYGSIGERHALWLKQLGCEVAVVSRREIPFSPRYGSVEEALKSYSADYAVIANSTSEHKDSLLELQRLGFQGKVLIEKPLFKDDHGIDITKSAACYVAYNLRFHPLLQRIRPLIENQKVIQAQIYVGKYLPSWRTGERIGYSGDKSLGGGVLRDLSHEIDYISWLLGPWVSAAGIQGHFSHLPITSDDAVSILGVTKRAPAVSLQMNYLDRIGRREIIINCDELTLYADLLHGTLQIDGSKEDFKVERADTYLAQHRAVLANDTASLCTYEEGLKTMKVISAIEKSSLSRQWVECAC